jgi:hypothetical protein
MAVPEETPVLLPTPPAWIVPPEFTSHADPVTSTRKFSKSFPLATDGSAASSAPAPWNISQQIREDFKIVRIT